MSTLLIRWNERAQVMELILFVAQELRDTWDSLSNLLHLYKVFKFESCKNRHVNIITGVINYDEAI